MAKQTFNELGTTGLEAYMGFVTEAYDAKLYWPTCIPLYNRIWRSDADVAIQRMVIEAFGARPTVEFALPATVEDPTDDDLAAVEFGNQVLDDMETPISQWLPSCLSRVLFYGWGWWEAPLAIRSADWRPPGGSDWQSEYDDNLIGFRDLAFRHYSSFYQWDLDDYTGRLNGMVQHDPPNADITIPLDRSLHITFGDSDNPEGLATFEALWRLERIKYGLEVIFGIGSEHTAGFLSVNAENKLTSDDHTIIAESARAILTAQEGNYAVWPKGFTGELIDSAFAAGETVLDAIRYFGILKLALLNMQWMALGTMSPFGSYSSMSDASQFFVSWFNSVVKGIISQVDKQLGKRLFNLPINRDAFPNMTARPVLTVTPIQKDIALADLAAFATAYNAIDPFADDDKLAIRRKSEFLPEVIADENEIEIESEDEASGRNPAVGGNGTGDAAEEQALAEFARRPIMVGDDELPDDVTFYADDPMEGLEATLRRFRKWARKEAPDLAAILDAEVIIE